MDKARTLETTQILPGARVLVAGGTGYIGRILVRELVARGYRVVCLVRGRDDAGSEGADSVHPALPETEVHLADVCDPLALSSLDLGSTPLAAAFSCLATRSGGIRDAWAVEHQANRNVMALAQRAGARQFVLLSAICVQKPRLAFQHAKLAFERDLIQSGMTFSIVRPTAFFKSLAGQVEAIQSGKPFTVFGNGELTACKPIAEADLACFLADCLTDADRWNAILPIGGPGEPITPRQQGELLFRLCGREPRFRHVPVRVFDMAVPILTALSRLVPKMADKAEFARIGRYYATESMLSWNPEVGAYDAAATPSWGADTLEDSYRRVPGACAAEANRSAPEILDPTESLRIDFLGVGKG